MGILDNLFKRPSSDFITIGNKRPSREETKQYSNSESITWGDIKKHEEAVCEFFISNLSVDRDSTKFSIEHRTDAYTSLFYGNNNFLRVKYTPDSKWLSFSLSNDDRKKYSDDPLFVTQVNKNQNHWRSVIASMDDLSKYIEIANNACYELKVCGDDPLSEAEQAVGDRLKEIMIKVGAQENHFKFRHLSDHAEICYIHGRIRYKCLKKKKSWIEIDTRYSKKMGNISKFEFNDVSELDCMEPYLSEYVAGIDVNSDWYLKNGY